MAITPERKAQLDAYVASQKKPPVTQSLATAPSAPDKGLFGTIRDSVGGVLQKAGSIGESFGQNVASVVTRPAVTGASVIRGLGSLASAGASYAMGNKDAALRSIERERDAQRREAARPQFMRPAQSMPDALGIGLKLGASLGAGALPPVSSASTAPGWVTGMTTAGIPALPASIGVGLENVKPGDSVLKSTSDVLQTGLAGTVGAMVVGAGFGGLEDVRRARVAAIDEKVAKASSQIAQSKLSNAEQHRRALLRLSPEERANVKTYADLDDVIDDNLDALKTAQDANLGQYKETKPLSAFDRTVGSGKSAVKTNPVDAAMRHLEEFYRKTNDPEGLSKILSLREKATTAGLTPAEINQIARDYGSNMPRAFSPKSGEPLTSVNAQAVENTRMAVKDAARSILPDKASQAADDAMADLLELKRSTLQIEEKVNRLNNKIAERGLGEKIGRALGWVWDKATFGTGKGFVTKAFFPSGVGEKELNFLDIQKALPRNLRVLDSLLAANDDELVSGVLNALKPSLGGPPLLEVPKSFGPGAARIDSPEFSTPYMSAGMAPKTPPAMESGALNNMTAGLHGAERVMQLRGLIEAYKMAGKEVPWEITREFTDATRESLRL